MGSGADANELPALSCFLGNDNIARLDVCNPVTSRELMDEFVRLDDTQHKLMIERLKATRKWNKNDSTNAQGFPDSFWKSYYLQKYPMFRLK